MSCVQLKFTVQTLCQMYRLSAEKIACEWLAFAASKKNVKLSVETLDQMDREVRNTYMNFALVSLLHVL